MININLYELVNKIIGNITPCGESNIDEDRANNLEEYIDLIDSMLQDVESIADNYKNSPANSERNVGQIANNFIEEIKKAYKI